MKAAILNELNRPLEIVEIDEPALIPNGVKVRVLSSYVMSFTKKVFSGASEFVPPVPYTPGLCAVGIVEAVADDVYGLSMGQKVFCHPAHHSQTNRAADDSILIGWFGVSPHSEKLLSLWKNGSFAEKAVYPARCVTPILDNEFGNPNQLCVLNILNIAYGALLNSGFKPSQTVIVNGATGNIGAGVVVMSLALGASAIIAVGREQQTLDQLQGIDSRIKTHRLSDNEEDNEQHIRALAEERHILIDASAADTPGPTQACIQALSPHGVAVLVGGVTAAISIPYGLMLGKQITVKGSYMFPDSAPAELLRMVGSKQINLGLFKINSYPLEKINEAIEKAPCCKGLECCVINPN